jgi:hypothetical protein
VTGRSVAATGAAWGAGARRNRASGAAGSRQGEELQGRGRWLLGGGKELEVTGKVEQEAGRGELKEAER